MWRDPVRVANFQLEARILILQLKTNLPGGWSGRGGQTKQAYDLEGSPHGH